MSSNGFSCYMQLLVLKNMMIDKLEIFLSNRKNAILAYLLKGEHSCQFSLLNFISVV